MTSLQEKRLIKALEEEARMKQEALERDPHYNCFKHTTTEYKIFNDILRAIKLLDENKELIPEYGGGLDFVASCLYPTVNNRFKKMVINEFVRESDYERNGRQKLYSVPLSFPISHYEYEIYQQLVATTKQTQEERFKAFNFEGRIISIKQEYQQKVTRLETQLKEMSDTCMKQVEEIESLKAENTKLQAAAAQKESLQAQLADKDAQLQTLKDSIAALQSQHSDQHAKQLASFTAQLRTLEEQRDRLAVELEQSQIALETIRREKELLEKNFKELVVKINDNDAVIGQLKEKIEVLGQQNTLLTQHNEELAHTNTALTQDNRTLSQTNVVLTQRNAALAQHNTSLTQQTRELQTQRTELTGKVEQLQAQRAELTDRVENLNAQQAQLAQQVASTQQANKALEQTNEQLEQTNKELDQANKELTQTNKDLAQTNEKLERTNQDLLEQPQNVQTPVVAAQQEPEELVAAAEHEETEELVSVAAQQNPVEELVSAVPQQPAETAQPSAALLAARVIERHAQQAARAGEPVAASLRRPSAPILHSLQRPLTSAAAEEEWEMVSAPVLSNTAKTIESTDDLPEIKVADPIPQEELYNGEDFLEKTGSFIGRIKWSIFRENR